MLPDPADAEFPVWLKLLLTCACTVKNFAVESVCMSTLLDLIGLATSVLADVDRKNDGSDSMDGGTVSVLILPLLTPGNLCYLNENTSFYKVGL